MSFTITLPAFTTIVEWGLWIGGGVIAFFILIEFIFWWAGARGD